MLLSTAQAYARRITDWLLPTTDRLAVTGSIRRDRPNPADVDLCIVPKLTIYRDMFGIEAGRQNHTWQFLVNYINNFRSETLKPNQSVPRILSGGETASHRMTLQLPSCQLDLWFADHENWSSKLVNSTGSKEHNIWLANRCADRGLHWFVSQGIARLSDLSAAGIDVRSPMAAQKARSSGLILPAADETDFYSLVGLDFIPPDSRELPWLSKHIDSGL